MENLTIDDVGIEKRLQGAQKNRQDNLNTRRKRGKKNEDKGYSIQRKVEKRGHLDKWLKRYETKNAPLVEDHYEDSIEEATEYIKPESLLEEIADNDLSHVDLRTISQAFKIDTHSISYVLGVTGGNREHAKMICLLAYTCKGEHSLKDITDLYAAEGYDRMMSEIIDFHKKKDEGINEEYHLNTPLHIPSHFLEDEANYSFAVHDDDPFYDEHNLHEPGISVVSAEELFPELQKEKV
jgi:hypothetical protein